MWKILVLFSTYKQNGISRYQSKDDYCGKQEKTDPTLKSI
jgi:hypothetical protein